MKPWWILLGLLHATAVLALEDFEADYRLFYNGELKGEAHFSLRILEQGKEYRFKATTRPAGKMADEATDHEVLESSHGHFDGSRPEPDNYYYAVKQAGKTHMVELFFDWKQRLLTLQQGEARQQYRLEEGAQDRLSYLLRAMALSAGLRAEASFPRVAPDGAERITLHKKLRKHLDTAAGRLLAQEVVIYSGSDRSHPTRRLWLAVNRAWVPLLMEHDAGDGVVRMELLRLEKP